MDMYVTWHSLKFLTYRKYNEGSNTISDRKSLEYMMHAVMRLSLSGFIFCEIQKSSAAVEYLKAWFLNEETKMRANLTFGQAIPGVMLGTVSASMDFYFSGRGFIDSIQLLLLTPGIEQFCKNDCPSALKSWAQDFVDYLYNDGLMQYEKESRNNHGVYFDLTVLSWA